MPARDHVAFCALSLNHEPSDFAVASKYQSQISAASMPGRIRWRSTIVAVGSTGSKDSYSYTLCRYRTAFASTYELRFSGDELSLKSSSIGARDSDRARLVGRA